VRINQIQTLAISLGGDCDSEPIDRFHKLFPNLLTLKHARRGKMGIGICEHRRPSLDEKFTCALGKEQKFEKSLDYLQFGRYIYPRLRHDRTIPRLNIDLNSV